ncbi:ribose-5-phosphate isomerase A, partial [Burkholderia contaminans]|uniref:ribose-5-phosphate isomerase A n=1 Tax=Burkholderia contaminans TaxID=488447 RepID=UPI0021BBEAED
MTQDELKRLVGQAAADYVIQNVPEGAVIGVGTGSTANCFIDALAVVKARYRGAVSSSVATTERLKSHGIKVFDLNEVDSLQVYVDGADEIDASGAMIKGGGGGGAPARGVGGGGGAVGGGAGARPRRGGGGAGRPPRGR